MFAKHVLVQSLFPPNFGSFFGEATLDFRGFTLKMEVNFNPITSGLELVCERSLGSADLVRQDLKGSAEPFDWAEPP